MFLKKRDQPALDEYLAHCGRQLRHCALDAARRDEHLPCCEIDLDFVTLVDAADIAFDRGQPVARLASPCGTWSNERDC